MPVRRVFLRNLVVPTRIGIHPHERTDAQRVRISVVLEAADDPPDPACLAETLDYERLAIDIRALAGAEHVELVESLAHRIAVLCLADARVTQARIRVEKLDVFADAESAGVEIVRTR